MKSLYFGPRQSGKTTKLVEVVREWKKELMPKGIQPYMIVFSEERVRQLRMQYPDLKENIVGWETAMRVRLGRTSRESRYAVDDIGIVVESMLGLPSIDIATMDMPPEIFELETDEGDTDENDDTDEDDQ